MKFPQKSIILFSYLCLAGILLLVLALYFPLLSFGWITGPDQDLVIDNVLVHRLSGNNIFDLFLSTTAGRYQPLTFLSYGLDISVSSGSATQMIHLVNLIYHLMNIILFFMVVKMLGKRVFIAVMATLLFAIHPMNVETIAWISSRSQLLSAFFFLSATLSYLYYLNSDAKRRAYFRLSTVFFILSMLSNPVAIAFPAAMMLIDHYKKRNIREALKEKLIMFSLSLTFIIIVVFIRSGTTNDIMAILPGTGEKVVYYLYAVSLLLVKFFVPYGLSAHHPFPSGISVVIIVFVLVLGVFIAMAFWYYRKKRILFYTSMFFFLSIFTSVLFSGNQPSMYRESEAYIPYMGLFILFVSLFSYVFDRTITRRKIIMLSVAIGLGAYTSLLTIGSHERIGTWENSEEVWSDVITSYPDDYYAYYLRGDHWAMNSIFEKAKFDYRQCARRNANAYKAINNLGLIYLEEGDLRLALAEFTDAIEISDHFYKAYLNRGITYMRIGNNELAKDDMDRAIVLNPDEPLAYYNRGLIHERLNSLPDAIIDFSMAIQLDPYRIIFYKDRGKAYAWMSEFHFAELDYSKAIELDPKNAEMWFRRSLARSSQEKFEKGLEDAFMARSLGFQVEEEYIKGLTIQILNDE